MPPKAKLLDIRYSTASVRTAHHVIERGAGRVRLGQVDGGANHPSCIISSASQASMAPQAPGCGRSSS